MLRRKPTKRRTLGDGHHEFFLSRCRHANYAVQFGQVEFGFLFPFDWNFSRKKLAEHYRL